MLDAADLVGRLASVAENVGLPGTAKIADRLPSLHGELLPALNGFTVQHGSLRIFAMGREDALDFNWWNDADTWRFAWDDRVRPYVSSVQRHGVTSTPTDSHRTEIWCPPSSFSKRLCCGRHR